MDFNGMRRLTFRHRKECLDIPGERVCEQEPPRNVRKCHFPENDHCNYNHCRSKKLEMI